MSHLLDTNVVIALLNRRSRAVRRNWLDALRQGVHTSTSSVVYFELYYGAVKSKQSADNIAKLDALVGTYVTVLPFEREDGAFAGKIRNDLEAAGTPIGAYDTLIAGQALRLGMTLVTGNTRELWRVRGLKLANWETT